jgi:hypothetical protein
MQPLADILVACLVPRQFGIPKCAIGARQPILAAIMQMPEAAMDEDHLFPGPENEIGIAGQISCMKAITVAHAMDKMPYDHLWSSIGVSDARHTFAPFRFG